MKLRILLVFSLISSLICSVPAEAADGSQISTAAVGAMVVGVGILAVLMKKFME
ncbi:MAG: hypothetical protein Q4F74_03345 [Synergistaceae bacterium]|nr:hypothetical protein [Synergistaceae bacterium]